MVRPVRPNEADATERSKGGRMQESDEKPNTTQTNDEWRLLTSDEATPILGYPNRKALNEAARKGLVPSVSIGRSRRFCLAKLREWAAAGGTTL